MVGIFSLVVLRIPLAISRTVCCFWFKFSFAGQHSYTNRNLRNNRRLYRLANTEKIDSKGNKCQ